MSVLHDTSIPSTAAAEIPTTLSRPRTWLRRIYGGGQIVETCPTWCTAHHLNDGAGALDDLVHDSGAVAVEVASHLAGAGFASWPILSARVVVDPYTEDAERNIPHVAFEPSVDNAIDLDPEEFAAVIAQVRAHLGELESVHAQLVAARAEYGAR